jgi:hopanoid C-3 methylase HpnR
MRVLFAHPGALDYSSVFLRLEPLGLELVAEAARRAGHQVRLVDLQVEPTRCFHRMVTEWRPDCIAFSCNYLANVPEIIDLAKSTKTALPRAFICVGGHSASFTARAIIDDSEGAIDCVLKGEGEAGIVKLLDAVAGDRGALAKVSGAVTRDGDGAAPSLVHSLDDLSPARDLLRHRRKYFIGSLDPAASIEFSRGCPWDCSFCSAWTFYGRSYRAKSAELVAEELASIREPGVFIVDDVAFIHDRHGFAVGEAIARKGIRKRYYLETRGDVLLRNKEVFRFWRRLGLEYIFIGIEAIDMEGLRKFRKRISLGQNFEALEFARSLGVAVAINIIADPEWDEERFAAVRQWCQEVPEIVNLSVNTPYPGTESWVTDDRRLETRDYRLFDVQHAVLPTRLPLPAFYREMLNTQRVLYRKHLNWRTAPLMGRLIIELLCRGQTNFVRGLAKWPSMFNLDKLLADHARSVAYRIPLPPPRPTVEQLRAKPSGLYIHAPRGRASRHIDDSTERFVDATRMGTTQ